MSTIGTIELLAKVDTSQYMRGVSQIDKANSDLEGNTEKSSGKMSGAFGMVAKVGLAALAAAVATVSALIVKNFDNAIRRVDTLNNSSRTFENMGFGAKQVEVAMKALEKSIMGLPTSLDSAVRGVQMIAASTNDIGKSQKIFAAMNNAIIGFGGSADDVTNAVLQMSQAFAGGKIDAQTWNSMLNSNLGPALNAIARTMGITTKKLKEGLSEGTISVEKFQDALISMNEKGGGGMKSFEQISKDATSGIQTGWSNMNTAITRGVASIIESVGSERIASGIGSFGKLIEGMLKSIGSFAKDNQAQIDTFFKTIGNGIAALNGFITDNKENIRLGFSVIAQSIVDVKNALSESMTALAPYKNEINQVAKILALVLAVSALGTVVAFAKMIEMTIQATTALIHMWEWVVKTGQDFVAWNVQLGKNLMAPFLGLPDFFRNLWGGIVKLFSSSGTEVGNAVANAFMKVINSVIRNAVGLINTFIRNINGVVGIVNKLPGVNVGKIGELGVPQLAQGGIVSSPTLAMIGEGRESEAVIPLSKLDKMINDDGNSSNHANITINLDGVMASSTADLREVAKKLVGAINDELAAKHKPLIGGGAI